MEKEKNFISAVIYVSNTENYIGKFLERINQFLNKNFQKYEIICVNDASTDNSVQEIRKISKSENKPITIINMSYWHGLEQSMTAGIDLSIGDFVYEFDNPFILFPDEQMVEVYKKCLEGYDIVSSCPKKSGHRLSTIFYNIYQFLSKQEQKLRTEAFRIISRRGINRVRSMERTNTYRKALYANCGLKTKQLIYENKMEFPAAAKKERKKQIQTAEETVILYTDVAYKTSIFFSALMMLIATIAGLYTCFIYFTGRPVAGWTTSMLLLSLGFFGVFLLITIIIRYLSLILKIIFQKQNYVIESIEKTN